LNAVVLTLVITVLLSLINIGSSAAFNNITSLGVNALLSSYIISISCLAIKRIRKEPLLTRRFSLGRFGLAVNIFAVLFLIFIYILCFFPGGPSPPPSTMNWSILIYGAVIIFSLVYYYFRGRKVYVGPVEYVQKDE
jgi:choline transport protein